MSQAQKNIPVIVLTGGPCAGKTSALTVLCAWLSDIGYAVITIPEGATEFISNSVTISDTKLTLVRFQKQLMQHILEKENRFVSYAHQIVARKKVVICNRGLMDTKAYLADNEFSKLLTELGLSIVDARDKRYDAVIHLQSAAIGAEKTIPQKIILPVLNPLQKRDVPMRKQKMHGLDIHT